MLLQSNRFADPSRLSDIHELERDTLSNPQPIKDRFSIRSEVTCPVNATVLEEFEEVHGRVNSDFP